MNAALERFCDELRAIPGNSANADDIAEWLDSQSDAEILTALSWIVSQPRGIVERLDAIYKLAHLPGPIVVSMRELTGWRL
jgi:hypothetical protein